MKKVLLQTGIAMGMVFSSVAHAAYADLTTFESDGAQAVVTLTTNSAILSETTDASGSFGFAIISREYQPLPIYSFEYTRSGADVDSWLVDRFGYTKLTAAIGVATIYSYNSPYSGPLEIELIGSKTSGKVVGTGTLSLRNFSTSPYIAPVPEPETYSMFLVGLGLMGAVTRRRFKSRGKLLAL